MACRVHGGLVEYDDYSNDARSYPHDHGGHVSHLVVDVYIDVDDARLPGVRPC
ncbi:hypothetical protein ACWEN4_01080 [Streptomyces violaceorubidus]